MNIVAQPSLDRNFEDWSHGWQLYATGQSLSLCINAQQRRGWRDAEIGEQACAIIDAVFACGGNASDADKALLEAW